MLRQPALPLLPGYSFNNNVGQTKFPRKQHFHFVDNLGILTDRNRGGSRIPSTYMGGETIDLPPWIVYDKQALKFDAFFQETLHEINRSPFQVREVKILFFLEDGTIQIHEPRVDNSGLTGGCLVKRQRIPYPPPNHRSYYDILDFNVGKEIEIYGRVYKITNCDNFTRTFLNRCGIAVPDPINTPDDPYKQFRASEKINYLARKPKAKYDTLGAFLKHDRQVLRFWGYWDDRASEFGQLHKLEVHYFLSDGTFEIKDILPPNAGIELRSMFLKKMKLPKNFTGLSGIGEITPVSLLNVIGSQNNSRFIDDPLNCGSTTTEYYSDRDLVIGGALNVFGRKVTLIDCDSFTKEYYRQKFGLDDFTPEPIPAEESPCYENQSKELPPWNGFGTHADSEINCQKFILKAPSINLKQFLSKDRQGFDTLQLRFSARMISNIPENYDRYFIITYYLGDKSISVYELACRNTGFSGGNFLRRMPVPKPGQSKFSVERPKLYDNEDLYVGAVLNLNGYTFKLTDADDYCYRYMELHKDEFPKADINLIMHKVREALKPVYREFVAEHIPKDCPIINFQTLSYVLDSNMSEPLTEHEKIMIVRNFAPECTYQRFTRNDLRQIVLTEIKRGLWNDLDRFKEHLKQMDPNGNGHLPKFECYNLIRACKLPLDVEVINAMFKVLCKDENCEIIYNDLVNFLDVNYEPLPDVPPDNYKHKLSWTSEKEPKRSEQIDWCSFNKFLNLEDTIPLPPPTPSYDEPINSNL